MAVRIEMDMPKSCDVCPFSKADNLLNPDTYACPLILDLAKGHKHTVYYWERFFVAKKETRNEHCPLKECE